MKYVDKFTDRHGRDRYYFRRTGRRVPLPGEPLSSEFMAAYTAALDSMAPTATRPTRERASAGTFAALAALYFASANYRGLSSSSRTNYRRVIDSFLVEHGKGRVDQFRRKHMIKIIGRMDDRRGAAIVLLKRVRTLISFAIDLEWIAADPTTNVRSYKSTEIYTWDEEAIAQFEARWPPGTRQRLAFDLLLFTGQRGSDTHRMIRPDKRGKIRVVQQKTGTHLSISTHPHLAESIAAVDATDARRHSVILATAYGAPFSVKGFGQFVSDAITNAGLPARCKAHGLRKAAARRLAQVGCSASQIMAVTGHKTLAEVERYVRAAEQERLNEDAMKQLGNTRLPNPTIPTANPIDIAGRK
jgi:integrase